MKNNELTPLETKLVNSVASEMTEADKVGLQKKLEDKERGKVVAKALKKNHLNLSHPWLLTPGEFERLAGVGNILAKNPKAAIEMLKARADFSKTVERGKTESRKGVAVIGVTGIIFRYENACADLFGESSVELLTKQIDAALADDEIKAILLNVNSPGGEADGISELSDKIFEARGKKPIVAYVSGIGASGAYWLASSAEKVIINETAAVGSIGALVQYEPSETEIITIVSNVSPKKAVDIMSDEGKAQIQNHVNYLANIFVQKVSRNRNASESIVESEFGQGDILFGKHAVGAGMVDELGTFESALRAALNGGKVEKNQEVKTKMKQVLKNTNGKIAAENVVYDDEEQQTPDGLTVEPLTKEFIEANEPEIAEAFREEGRQEEANRQEDIDQDVEPEDEGEQEMIREAKFGAKRLSSDQLKAQLFSHRSEKKKQALNKVVKDSEKLQETTPAAEASAESQAESIMANAGKKVAGVK